MLTLSNSRFQGSHQIIQSWPKQMRQRLFTMYRCMQIDLMNWWNEMIFNFKKTFSHRHFLRISLTALDPQAKNIPRKKRIEQLRSSPLLVSQCGHQRTKRRKETVNLRRISYGHYCIICETWSVSVMFFDPFPAKGYRMAEWFLLDYSKYRS